MPLSDIEPMQPVAVDKGAPQRLLRQGATWVLEVSKLTSAGGGVFRPSLSRVEGLEHIVHFFKKNPDAAKLAAPALKLIQATPAHSNLCCYEVVDGEWLPCPIKPEDLTSGSANSNADPLEAADAALDAELALIRSQLDVLKADYTRLVERAAKLESTLAGIPNISSHAHAHDAAANSEPEPAEPATPELADSLAGNATGVDESLALGSEAADAGLAVVDSGDTSQELEDLPPLEPLMAPRARELEVCLGQLVGKEIPLRASRHELDLTGQNLFASLLLDDSNRVLGALVLDAEAVVRIGGGLMMIPESVLDEQVRARKPTEDCVEAASEVCNTLTAPVNRVDGNAHVRSEPLGPLDIGSESWALTPRNRLDLEAAEYGYISFIAR